MKQSKNRRIRRYSEIQHRFLWFYTYEYTFISWINMQFCPKKESHYLTPSLFPVFEKFLDPHLFLPNQVPFFVQIGYPKYYGDEHKFLLSLTLNTPVTHSNWSNHSRSSRSICLWYWPSLYYYIHVYIQARIQNFFKGEGGLRRKILKEKCLLIHDVTYWSTCVHIKLDKHATFSLFFFFNRIVSIFCSVLLLSFITEIWKGGGWPPPPRNRPSRSANDIIHIDITRKTTLCVKVELSCLPSNGTLQ